MDSSPAALNEADFSAALERCGAPLVVDFWAPWCGPCRSTSPVFALVAKEFAERCTFGMVNVDVCADLARRYGVRAIPTILAFTDGKLVARAVGAQSAEQLRYFVNAVL